VVSAVRSNQVGARKILIAAKADVNIPDNSGKTSLFYAKLSGNEEVIALLAAAGASE
jgi:ankyrin repeat protein